MAVNVTGAAAAVVGSIPGMTGTMGAVLENSQNAGGYGNLLVLNPQGDQNPYGGKLSGMDEQGAGNVGGRNGPPVSARSGVTPGDGTSTSCMTNYELGANNGSEPPPPENLIGSPEKGDCEDFEEAAFN